MNYVETKPPPQLYGFVKAFWSLSVNASKSAWVEHRATPDGCIEIIRRLSGRSLWMREQPTCFAAGLSDQHAPLRFSGDASFVAVRFWPWTWHLLGGLEARLFWSDWIDVGQMSTLESICGVLDQPEAAQSAIWNALTQAPQYLMVQHVGRAILTSSSVEEILAQTGYNARWLQRWATTYLGIPLRTYLRLLRFQNALSDVQTDAARLADHAPKHGFADEAHLSREFRKLAGGPPSAVRRGAKGPFIPN